MGQVETTRGGPEGGKKRRGVKLCGAPAEISSHVLKQEHAVNISNQIQVHYHQLKS